MSVLHLVLTVVWAGVSVAFALLARFKHKLDWLLFLRLSSLLVMWCAG